MKHFSLCATGLTAALLLTLGASAAMAGGETRTFTKGDDKSSASLSVGQSFSIKLPVQMGTGYSWKTASVPAGVKAGGESKEGAAAAPGGSETQVFKFTAEKPGDGALSLQYRRPWEKDAPAAETFTLNVSVKP
jgi:inhibitor of cysteine peptidase